MTVSRATKLGLLPNVPSGKRDGHGDCWQAMPCTCLPSPLCVPVALIYFSLFCLSYLETQLLPSNVNRQGNCHGIGIRGNVGHACNPSGQGLSDADTYDEKYGRTLSKWGKEKDKKRDTTKWLVNGDRSKPSPSLELQLQEQIEGSFRTQPPPPPAAAAGTNRQSHGEKLHSWPSD